MAHSLINYKPIAILHTILNSFAPPLPSNEETASANIPPMWGLHLCLALDSAATALNHTFDLYLLVRYGLLKVPTELWLDFLSNKPKHDRSDSRKLQLYRLKVVSSSYSTLSHNPFKSWKHVRSIIWMLPYGGAANNSVLGDTKSAREKHHRQNSHRCFHLTPLEAI